jgi:hypothetical protein
MRPMIMAAAGDDGKPGHPWEARFRHVGKAAVIAGFLMVFPSE